MFSFLKSFVFLTFFWFFWDVFFKIFEFVVRVLPFFARFFPLYVRFFWDVFLKFSSWNHSFFTFFLRVFLHCNVRFFEVFFLKFSSWNCKVFFNCGLRVESRGELWMKPGQLFPKTFRPRTFRRAILSIVCHYGLGLM